MKRITRTKRTQIRQAATVQGEKALSRWDDEGGAGAERSDVPLVSKKQMPHADPEIAYDILREAGVKK